MPALKHSCDLNRAEVGKEDKIVFAQKTKTTISSKKFIHILNVLFCYLSCYQTLNSAFNTLLHVNSESSFDVFLWFWFTVLLSAHLKASAVRNLRLVSFEAAEGSSCCSRLCDPITPADTFKFPLSHHFHGDSDLPIVSSLRWAAKTRQFKLEVRGICCYR